MVEQLQTNLKELERLERALEKAMARKRRNNTLSNQRKLREADQALERYRDAFLQERGVGL